MSRVVIYDATDTSPDPELKDAWRLGATLFRAVGRFDRVFGAASWNHALSFLRGLGLVDEVQYWGHGSPGRAYCAGEVLDPARLEGVDVRRLFWLRTCASFAGPRGHQLAEDMSAALGCTVAAHTYNIGIWQSGLHTLRPMERPYWPKTEGLRDGRVMWSAPWAVHTISCMQSTIPQGW